MKSRPLPLYAFAALIALMLFQSAYSHAEGDPRYELDEETMSVDLCMTCHGTYGQGNQVVGGPSLAGLEVWYIKRQLKLFREGLRGTQPDYIPGYEMRKSVEDLNDEQINSLTSYISNWKPVSLTATLKGDMEKGRQLYSTCAVCHGINGEGNETLGSPGLAGRNDWYMLRQLKLFESGYRGSHPEDTAGRQMRSIMQSLSSEQDMIDVLTYVNTL